MLATVLFVVKLLIIDFQRLLLICSLLYILLSFNQLRRDVLNAGDALLLTRLTNV